MGDSTRVTASALRAFAAVARTGSFTGAANTLGVSQPSVSTAVARLEARGGRPLLRREQGGVTLTPHGRRVLERALPALAALDEVEAALSMADPSDLTLGFMGEAAGTRTSTVINVVREQPGIRLALRRFDFDDPTCGLLTGDTDLAVIWPPVSTDALETLPLATDRRAIALPVAHPLAARHDLHPDDLHGLAWVTPRSPDPEWARFRAPSAIGATGGHVAAESNALEETLESVAAGVGIALVSMSTDQHYARSGVVIVPLRGNHHCTTVLAWRRQDTRPPITATVEHLRASL
ncbi:LysR family transcriptional regulator [Actinomadura harenae]|uniref:LysR family transcriptional regulator n=1 Tax=Actinomadura harenae TaxID=2483351 RepID=A0A3M2MCL4_9ACTN|nr:LysR family transcriptional regulator [Actinomadura harenae]RMI44938.1 LysR family transcriptional regulator [Actinomadura harenae]